MPLSWPVGRGLTGIGTTLPAVPGGPTPGSTTPSKAPVRGSPGAPID